MQNIVVMSKKVNRIPVNVDELNDCNPFIYLNGMLCVVNGVREPFV